MLKLFFRLVTSAVWTLQQMCSWRLIFDSAINVEQSEALTSVLKWRYSPVSSSCPLSQSSFMSFSIAASFIRSPASLLPVNEKKGWSQRTNKLKLHIRQKHNLIINSGFPHQDFINFVEETKENRKSTFLFLATFFSWYPSLFSAKVTEIKKENL